MSGFYRSAVLMNEQDKPISSISSATPNEIKLKLHAHKIPNTKKKTFQMELYPLSFISESLVRLAFVFLQGTSYFFNTSSIFNRDPPPMVLLNFWKVHKKKLWKRSILMNCSLKACNFTIFIKTAQQLTYFSSFLNF